MSDRVEIELYNSNGGIKKCTYLDVSDVYSANSNLILCVGDRKQQIQIPEAKIKRVNIIKKDSEDTLSSVCD